MELHEVPKESVVGIANTICDHLNSAKTFYNSKISVDLKKFFWAEDATFSEVYGWDGAFEELCYSLPPGAEDYYERNKKEINLFFRPGTMTSEQAKRIRAPILEATATTWPTFDFDDVDPVAFEALTQNTNNSNKNNNMET